MQEKAAALKRHHSQAHARTNVGNLAFTTTEEQLYSAFSELGRIIKVRMVSDIETGKPRGFAFIEFEDPQAALSGNVLYVAIILLLLFFCDIL